MALFMWTNSRAEAGGLEHVRQYNGVRTHQQIRKKSTFAEFEKLLTNLAVTKRAVRRPSAVKEHLLFLIELQSLFMSNSGSYFAWRIPNFTPCRSVWLRGVARRCRNS